MNTLERGIMAITTEAEYTEIYRANYVDVLRFVQRRAHPMSVDDIVGETFLAAWRRRTEVPDDARPWLFRTARNAMANAGRGQNRQVAVAVRIGEHGVPLIDGMQASDRRIDVVAAWRELPTADQEVLALHVWEDLDAREAAAVLGCTRATYSMRLTRAKRHLKSILETSFTAQPAVAR